MCAAKATLITRHWLGILAPIAQVNSLQGWEVTTAEPTLLLETKGEMFNRVETQ